MRCFLRQNKKSQYPGKRVTVGECDWGMYVPDTLMRISKRNNNEYNYSYKYKRYKSPK